MKINQQSARNITSIILHPDKATDKIKAKYRDDVAAVTALMDEKGITVNESVYLYRNGIQEIPKCKVCGTQLEFNLSRYVYDTFCSHKCRSAFQNCAKDSVIVDGVEFGSIKEAYTHLGISRFKFKQMLLSPNSPNIRYTNDHDAKCLVQLKDAAPILSDSNEINSLKESGVPIKDVALKLGLNHSTVMQAYIYHDVSTKFEQIDKDSRIKLEDKEFVQELYVTKSTQEIAELLDVSSSTVINYMKLHGIERNDAKQQSAIEREIIDFLSGYNVNCISRDYTFGVELDIYIPDFKLAIELNGVYFHGYSPYKTTNMKPKDHSKKQMICAQNGVVLLQFHDVGETDDINKLTIIKSMILNRIKKVDKRIYARKCSVKSISVSEARTFSNRTHLSGHCNASVYYGLYHDDVLVQVMTFGKPRFNKNYDWEIIRLSSELNMNVVGGASKLFNHFLKNMNGSIMSYADLFHGDGSVYSMMGFERIENTKPGFFYTDLKTNYSRFAFHGEGIRKLCPMYDDTKSMDENIYANGYIKYTDAGNAVYVYIR